MRLSAHGVLSVPSAPLAPTLSLCFLRRSWSKASMCWFTTCLAAQSLVMVMHIYYVQARCYLLP